MHFSSKLYQKQKYALKKHLNMNCVWDFMLWSKVSINKVLAKPVYTGQYTLMLAQEHVKWTDFSLKIRKTNCVFGKLGRIAYFYIKWILRNLRCRYLTQPFFSLHTATPTIALQKNRAHETLLKRDCFK